MKNLFLVIFFAMSFRLFQFFPGMSPIQESWSILCFVFLVTVYPFWKWRTGWCFSLFELYLLGMMLFIPLMAGFSASREFGQPLVYGILSQRPVALFAAALLLNHCLRHGMFRLRDVERALLSLAWGTLFLYLAMKAFLDPLAFSSGKGFVIEGEHPSFILPGIFIAFGLYYYVFLGFRTRRRKYYLIAGMLAAFLLSDVGGRSMTVAMFASFVFFIWRWGKARRLITFLPKALAAITLSLGIAYAANPESVSSKFEKFSDAFTVVLTGNEVEDVSANARVLETMIAMPYVQKNPWLGNGNISNQWQGGNEQVLGGYFHPSDIGIIGVLFMYGVTGLLLFCWQYWFAIKAAGRAPPGMHSPLLDATKAMLLYLAIYSLATGFFVHYAETCFLLIALLGCTVSEMRARWASDVDTSRIETAGEA